jgi:hypothetical protein
MKSGQFVIGMVNGNNESYESPDLAQLLPADKLGVLWDLAKTRGVGTHSYIDYDERVIARTTVTNTPADEMGRKGTLNHTVIFKFDSHIYHDGVRYDFNVNDFAVAYQSGKLQIQTVATPKLSNPLPKPDWR